MTDDVSITTQKEAGMPWEGQDFKKKNKKLSGHKLKVAAAAANAALKAGKSESAAVRIGNSAGNKAKA